MKRLKKKSLDSIERLALRSTRFIGSTESLLIHTILFIGSFVLYFFGVPFEEILLVVTTIVSLEAIYLSIFIQMSVNRQIRKLHAVARDVDEIAEDVEEIQEDDKEEEIEEKKDEEILSRIEDTMGKLIEEVMELKNQQKQTIKTKTKK